MKPAVAGALAGSSILCVAAAYFLMSPTAPASAPEPSASVEAGGAPMAGPELGCSFEPGAQLAYALSSTVSARDADGAALSEADHLSAVLSARVVSSTEDRASLQLALSQVELRQELANAEDRVDQPLDATFEIDLTASCRIAEFRFPANWSGDARRLVANALRTHEHVLEPSTRSWEADQTDALGRYRAQYTRSDDAIVRDKVHYYDDEGLATFGMSIAVPHSTASATFGPDGVQTSKVRERVQIRVGREVRADLDQRSQLVRDDSKFQAPAAAGLLAAMDPFAVEEPEGSALPEAPASLDQALALYEQLAGSLDPFTMSQARALAGLIAAYPSLADDLVARLDGDALSEVGRSSVFWVLELAGTDHARGHLTNLLDAERPNDRIRAAVALSGAAPTLEVGHRLLEMYYEDGEHTARSAGLLALGVVGANGDAATKQFARESIGAAFEDAQTHGETVAALAAMGNAGDPEFMPQLTESLGDANPTVRAKAAEAMRNMGDEARPHLQAALEGEVEVATAKSVVRTLREIGPPQGEDFDWAAERLGDAPSAAVRGELIAWLGDESSEQSTAILVERFHAESSSELRQLIGRYVPASELMR